jgi:hypothetical protein
MKQERGTCCKWNRLGCVAALQGPVLRTPVRKCNLNPCRAAVSVCTRDQTFSISACFPLSRFFFRITKQNHAYGSLNICGRIVNK